MGPPDAIPGRRPWRAGPGRRTRSPAAARAGRRAAPPRLPHLRRRRRPRPLGRGSQAARRAPGDRPARSGSTRPATADVGAVRRLLAAGSGCRRAARADPYGWPPLLYLAYARHDLAVPEAAVLAVAQALLDARCRPKRRLPLARAAVAVHGADRRLRWRRARPRPPTPPSARPSPRSAAPRGRGRPERRAGPLQPHVRVRRRPPRAAPRARPRSGRTPRPVAGPARQRAAVAPRPRPGPAAVGDHPRPSRRVALLAEHGADLAEPDADGRTPADLAALNGNTAIEAALMAAGAASVQLWGADALVAAAMRGDGETADELVAQDPGVVTAAREARPGLLVWAASQTSIGCRRAAPSPRLGRQRRGRADAPVEMPWETALHAAAGDGDLELARLLLARGADPSPLDARFESTPLGWAGYFGRTELIALLEARHPRWYTSRGEGQRWLTQAREPRRPRSRRATTPSVRPRWPIRAPPTKSCWRVARSTAMTASTRPSTRSAGTTDVQEALRDIRTYSSHYGQGPNMVVPGSMQSDPPQHTFFRRLVQQAFTPRAVADLRPQGRGARGQPHRRGR